MFSHIVVNSVIASRESDQSKYTSHLSNAVDSGYIHCPLLTTVGKCNVPLLPNRKRESAHTHISPFLKTVVIQKYHCLLWHRRPPITALHLLFILFPDREKTEGRQGAMADTH